MIKKDYVKAIIIYLVEASVAEECEVKLSKRGIKVKVYRTGDEFNYRTEKLIKQMTIEELANIIESLEYEASLLRVLGDMVYGG